MFNVYALFPILLLQVVGYYPFLSFPFLSFFPLLLFGQFLYISNCITLLPFNLRLKLFVIDLDLTEAGDVPATVINNNSLPVHSHLDSSSPLLIGSDHQRAVARRGKTILAALYGIQVFYSFFIM